MTRYTLEIKGEAVRTLNEVAETKGIGLAELIKRSVATYAYFDQELKRPEMAARGAKVSVTDADDNVVRDIFLP